MHATYGLHMRGGPQRRGAAAKLSRHRAASRCQFGLINEAGRELFLGWLVLVGFLSRSAHDTTTPAISIESRWRPALAGKTASRHKPTALLCLLGAAECSYAACSEGTVTMPALILPMPTLLFVDSEWCVANNGGCHLSCLSSQNGWHCPRPNLGHPSTWSHGASTCLYLVPQRS